MEDDLAETGFAILRREISILRDAVGVLQQRVASSTGIDTGIRQKVLTLDMRVAAIERGISFKQAMATKTYSD